MGMGERWCDAIVCFESLSLWRLYKHSLYTVAQTVARRRLIYDFIFLFSILVKLFLFESYTHPWHTPLRFPRKSEQKNVIPHCKCAFYMFPLEYVSEIYFLDVNY